MISIFIYQIKKDPNISDSDDQSSISTGSESDNFNLDNDEMTIQVKFTSKKIFY